MGYILPINHYQYNDYQKRVNRVRQNRTMSVDKAFKVVLEKQHENVRSQYQQYHESSAKPSPNPEYGKGKNFHAII